MDMTSVYAPIVKSTPQDDGSLLVYGKATDSSLDLDEQVADSAWLSEAVPRWFTVGNVREQHAHDRAVGKATELDSRDDGAHYVTAKIVDPLAKAKVEAGVLSGFSIGIKNPRVIKDAKAPGGRIVGGRIVELSLVDFPCNESCRLDLVKAVKPGVSVTPTDFDADRMLVKVEELHEDVTVLNRTADDAAVDASLTGSAPEPPAPEVTEHKAGPGAAPQAIGPDSVAVQPPATEPVPVETKGVGWDPEELVKRIVAELGKREFTQAERDAAVDRGDALPDGSFPIETGRDVRNAVREIGRAKDPAKAKAHIKRRAMALKHPELIPDSWKATEPDITKADDGDATGQTHDPAELKTILQGLVDCMKIELDEMVDGDNEIADLGELLRTVRLFTDWWSSEAAGGETDPPFTDDTNSPIYIGMAAEPEQKKATVTDQPETSEPSGSVEQTRLTELVKSALADAQARTEERIKALEADLAKALALPEPGGPVIARTATQAAVARDTDAVLLKTAAAELLVKADRATDPYLAKGYRERAAALTAQAVA